MTAITLGIPTSDSAVSSDAQHLYRDRVRGLFESPSVGSLNKQQLLVGIQEVAQNASSDNWDGEGGMAVRQAAVRNAIKFALLLPEGVARPDIVADRDGELVFDWDPRPGVSYSVSVGRDGTIRYAGIFGSSKTYGTDLLSDCIPPAVVFHLQRAARA